MCDHRLYIPFIRMREKMQRLDDIAINNDERTVLQLVDHERFFFALDHTPTPTDALRAVFRRREEAVTGTDGDQLNLD